MCCVGAVVALQAYSHASPPPRFPACVSALSEKFKGDSHSRRQLQSRRHITPTHRRTRTGTYAHRVGDVRSRHAVPTHRAHLASRKHHRTRVAFCLDDDRKVLVVGADAKTAQEFAVAGQAGYTKFVSAGNALTIVRHNIQIMLSEADPSDLTRWCTSLTVCAASPKDSLPLGGAPTIFSLPPKRHLGPSSPAGRISPVKPVPPGHRPTSRR